MINVIYMQGACKNYFKKPNIIQLNMEKTSKNSTQ